MEFLHPATLDGGAVALGFEGCLAVGVVPASFQGAEGLDVGDGDPRLVGEKYLPYGTLSGFDVVRVPLPELQLVDL